MNKRARLDFWDMLLYGSGITIIVWALLKSFGIINTPVWVEMLPYIAIGVSIFSGVYKFGKIMENIDRRLWRTEEKVTDLILDFRNIKEDFIKVKHNQILCMNGKLGHSPYKKRF